MNNKIDILDKGKEVLINEGESLLKGAERLDNNFVKAVSFIYECTGRIVITGMGKSGHIASKIVATFASTGTPSLFMHPAEAVHGDLGMLTASDVVIALSYSGETEEIKQILPSIKRLKVPIISITGNINSTLAKNSDATLNGQVEKEACSMNLAPTSSTTLALALGDALAVAVAAKRGFIASDFAMFHPSGSLGKRLLLRVKDVWHSGDSIPVINMNTNLNDLLYIMSSKKLGCAVVVDGSKKLLGIITDGDIRRGIEKYRSFDDITVDKLLTRNPKLVNCDMMAIEALHVMETYNITTVISVNDDNIPDGVVHLHDLLKSGLR